MEQTVNTFGKGLQMDTNPMVQGNETLSNALNATFVTMNGNEVILQNDMGNRRVDNAYLPSGYEPVGIKEHGGVIYLALYNPITNRSQIGSFPSPERNIDGENVSGLLAGLWLDRAITEKLSFEENGIHYLNGDTLLTLLSNDTSLHAGDKFTVYCSENNIIWNPDVSKQISNFDLDTDRDKKRKFTLSLGVLNSLNEFVDITHTLKRFDENGKMLNDDDFESEEERFNTGYFISKSAPSTTQIDRDKIAANTYAYKLVGPLYIKNEISHFSDFSYTLEAGKNGNEITLIFTGTATCNYLFDYLNNHVFDVRIKDKNGNIINYSEEEGKKPSFVITKGENSYTQVAKYTFEASGEITYYIDVFGTKVDNTIYYLKDLSDYGTLNTEYINSNVCKFTGWRYSVDSINKTCHISYSFEAYPSSTTTFDNLEIKINNVKIEGLNPIIYTGRRDFVYEYSLDRKVLNVEISYKDNSLENPDVTISRFILTTELFNPCYSPSSEDYVPDYGLFMNNEDSYKEDDYTDEFKEKLHNIKNRYLTVTPVIDGEIDPKSTPIEVPDDFKYFVKQPVDNKIICTTTNKYNIYVDTSNLTMGIQNENSYPSELKLSSTTIDLKTLDIDTFNTTKDSLLDDSILEYRPSSFKENLKVSTLIANASKDSSESNITLTYYDKFIAQAVTENRTVSKLFVNLNSDLAIEKYIKGLKNSNSGWSMSYYMGGKLHHWWRLWINSNNVSSFDAGFSRNMLCNENDWGDREFPLTSDLSDWFDEDGNFNSAHLEMCTACSENSIPFICGANLPNLENIHFVDSTNPRTSINSGKSAKYYCKVWLVNVSGTLTILENNNSDYPGLFKIENLEKEIAEFIGTDNPNQGNLGNPYVVPVENITLREGDIYYPSNENYIYNNKYSFNFPVTVTATKNNLSLTGLNEKILFKLPDTSVSTTKSKELSFSSDNNFVGKVQGILLGDIFNKPIYIETGEVVENISNKILKYVSGKLEIASQAPFEIQDGKLKCTKTVAESLTHKNSVMAMVTSDGDKWITALLFGKVPVLKKEHML